MSSTHLDYNFIMFIASIFLFACFELSPANEASARALDLSWRPLYHSPHQQQLLKAYSSPPATSFISYSNLDSAHKDEVREAAKHNAHLLKKLKELSNQPITSYNDPYYYSQTPGPVKKSTPNAAFYMPNLATITNLLPSASSTVISRHPYPGKGMSLYQTKINFIGKDNHHYNHNSIHQIVSTTPKIEYARVSPHFHLTPIVSTTKKIPIFSSSVTPHPVMNKLQAHLSLSPAPSSSHSHLKIKQNILFSPPSQIMSNYANFGTATNKPIWHHPSNLNPQASQYHHFLNDNRHIHSSSHHHPPKYPEAQKQQQQHQHQKNNQIMAEVHPSILTPFIEQVQLKQKEVEQQKKHQNVKIEKEKVAVNNENESENFEMVNDVFSKHLVPPPPSVKPTAFTGNHHHNNHDAPQNISNNKKKNQEKLNKFNLSMKSPLQDASRFNYENVVSTNRPSTPNVFVHLNNRTKSNVYKHHKTLHPSYNKKKPFLPTPYEPENTHEIVGNGYEPQHTFFTIDDAVTPNIPSFVESSKIREQIPVAEEIYENYNVRTSTSKAAIATSTFRPASTTEETPIVRSTLKPRQKLRRRKPKPKQQQQQVESQQESDGNFPTSKTKQKIADVDENVLKTRNKINHPNRSRNKFSTQSTAPSGPSTTSDESQSVEVTTPTTASSVSTTLSTAADTSRLTSENPDPNSNANVKRRVRLRFKNKLRTTTSDPAAEDVDFDNSRPATDNQISESENENFAFNIKTKKIVSDIATTPTTAYSGLVLPNLKFKNEIFTTFPTTAAAAAATGGGVESSSLSSFGTSGPTTSTFESTIPSKIPRPRFSIKEIKRKQLAQEKLTPSSTTTTTTTTQPPSTPDGQRFNRFRASFNRRKNETVVESGEENERKKSFTLRTSSSVTSALPTLSSTITTTESPSPTTSIPRRSTSPKRTFPQRNFTKPAVSETETVSTVKPSRSTAISSRGNFRAKLKKKEQQEENEISAQSTTTTNDPTNYFNLDHINSRGTSTFSSTSTEAPSYKQETSIMKIAKTPSSVSKPSNLNENDWDQSSSLATLDNDLNVSPSEHLQRVVELTLSGNENQVFKSANIGSLSRRIPNYFTISTDDPILPIQAFFPQINTNE